MTIKRRLDRLEQSSIAKSDAVGVVFIRTWLPSPDGPQEEPLGAYWWDMPDGQQKTLERLSDESEEVFEDRALAAARSDRGDGVLVLSQC